MKISEIKVGQTLVPTKDVDKTYPRLITKPGPWGFEFQRVRGDGVTGAKLMCGNPAMRAWIKRHDPKVE